MNEVSRYCFAEVKAAANGLWPGILISAGIAPELLNHRHHPCPGCGGVDRFRFVDKKGDGFFICNGGGDRVAGDGFRLLEHVHGLSPSKSLRFVADYLGLSDREIAKADLDAYRNQQILKAFAHEVEVLRVAVADRLAKKTFSDADKEREQIAVRRVRDALGILYDGR